ncbi:MAG: hypothetical protein JST30_16415 [Armatimonadetes bacterium]|nr:hypothetical protein [Armatimonadota bacterium]
MRRTAIVLPGLLRDPGSDSLLKNFEPIQRLAGEGEIVRNPALPESGVPELAYLALDPRRFDVRPGPIMVSALKADPPLGSIAFHLSVGSTDGENLMSAAGGRLDEDDAANLKLAMERLRTATMTPIWGESLDHALVWEGGSTDNSTTDFAEVLGTDWTRRLPEGDGDGLLRRFVDDSVNLLHESDSNKRRVDEGRPPLNVLWPWGQGRWERCPNLVLRRGVPVEFVSLDLRIEGLARLFGYSHGPRVRFGRRLAPRLDAVLERAMASTVTVVVLDHIGEAVRHERLDLAEEHLQALAEGLLIPLATEREAVVSVTALDERTSGLTLLYGGADHERIGRVPFDERATEEKGIVDRPLWKSVEAVLRA